MTDALSIAVGGAVGALLRYWVSTGVYTVLGRGFPYGTLAVNVMGSLCIGALTVLLIERLNLAPQWRAGLLIGLLGAFTTFSTFSIETLYLLEHGDWFKALLNIAMSVVLCVAAAWVGLIIGRAV